MPRLDFLVAFALVSQAPAVLAAAPSPGLSTAKSVHEFTDCFLLSQERAGHPVSFVPNPRGGVFSNAGATGVSNAYRLRLADAGSNRSLQLDAVEPQGSVEPRIASAVEGCV